MEYDYDNEKIGGGIITISVLHFITSFFCILGGIILCTAGSSSEIKEQLEALDISISTGNVIFSDIILRIFLIIALILILKKNKLGVYGYYIFVVVSIISTIVSSGFNLFSLLMSLLFPILMGIFIYKKRTLFNI